MLGAGLIGGRLQRAEQEIEILAAIDLGQLGRRFGKLLLLAGRLNLLRQGWSQTGGAQHEG